MQVPQPVMGFPQPPVAAQPVIPNIPPPNVVPTAPAGYVAAQAYAQPGAGATMPQPVVPNIAAVQNNAAPVIPQMAQQGAMAMPEPVVEPDPPRSRSRMGPGRYGSYDGRRRTPSPAYRDPPPSHSHNPLPRPPRDLFDSTPYIRLLDELRRPIDSDTLKRNLSVKTMQTQVNVPLFPSGGSGARRERKHRKGLFGVFGRRHRDEGDDQDLVSPVSAQVFYPAVPVQQPYVAAPQMMQADSGGGVPVPVPAAMPVPSRGPTPVPVREPSPVPPVRVHRQNELAGLIPSSPHSVHWNHKSWPTASHLHEALKFMGHRPDIAEEIRHCPTVDEARSVSIANEHHIRDDWGQQTLKMVSTRVCCLAARGDVV